GKVRVPARSARLEGRPHFAILKNRGPDGDTQASQSDGSAAVLSLGIWPHPAGVMRSVRASATVDREVNPRLSGVTNGEPAGPLPARTVRAALRSRDAALMTSDPAITEDMRAIVDSAALGFVATTCPDGSPNLSPKGSIRIYDARHLVFANICLAWDDSQPSPRPAGRD